MKGEGDSSPYPDLYSECLLGFLMLSERICQCQERAGMPTPTSSPQVLGLIQVWGALDLFTTPPGGLPWVMVSVWLRAHISLDWQREEEGKEKRIEFNSGEEGTESLGMSASGQVGATWTSLASCLKQTNKTDKTVETVLVKTLDFRSQRATIPVM